MTSWWIFFFTPATPGSRFNFSSKESGACDIALGDGLGIGRLRGSLHGWRCGNFADRAADAGKSLTNVIVSGSISLPMMGRPSWKNDPLQSDGWAIDSVKCLLPISEPEEQRAIHNSCASVNRDYATLLS